MKILMLLFLLILPMSCIPKTNAFWIILTSPDLDYHFSYPTLYQGDEAHVNVTVISNYDKEVVIKWIGLRFDWMTEWSQKDLSSNPIALNKSDTVDFGRFDFQIPSDITVGNHTLTICIEYGEFIDEVFNIPKNACIIAGEPIETVEVYVGWYNCLPQYKSYTFEVHSLKEKQYYELKPTVFQQLTKATEQSYLSGGAKSLLQQANSKYNEATSLAEQKKWSEAYELMQLTQSLLNMIPSEEQNFIMLITGSVCGIVVIIGLVIYLLKKR